MRETVYILATNSDSRFRPVSKLEANSVDLFFETDRLLPNKMVAELDLNIKVYSRNSSFWIAPRSSASAIQKQVGLVGDSSTYEGLTKFNISLANTIGYIDWNYRGPVMARAIVANDAHPLGIGIKLEHKAYFQLVPCGGQAIDFVIVDNVSMIPEDYHSSVRGEGGFGSSDKLPNA